MREIRLSRHYLLIGIPWIIISVIGVTWMYRVVALEDLKRVTEKNTTTLSRTLANVIWPQINHMVKATAEHEGKDHKAHLSGILSIIRTLLDEPIADLLRDTTVIKIKIFNDKGLTVYSTDFQQSGVQMEANYKGSRASRRNQIISLESYHKSIKDFRGNMLDNRFVISSYVPLNVNAKNYVNGVFEIYNDATDIYEHINESQTKFGTTLATVLFFIYFTVYFFVRRVDTVVKNNIELAVARDTEREANQAKSTFLANMSHELRTPLNAIIGYSEMIQEVAYENQDHESLQDSKNINAAARHLLHLINEVLDISKIEAGRLSTSFENFNLKHLIDDVGTLIEPVVQKNNNRLNIQLDESIGRIISDPLKLRQILFNLLSNAAKFTQNGEINFIIKKAGGWMTIIVSDTGIGIKKDSIDKVFKPFSQVDLSSTRKFEGTGLGLAITKNFCEMLGGNIRVESEFKKGTTFIIELPLEPTEKTIQHFQTSKAQTVG